MSGEKFLKNKYNLHSTPEVLQARIRTNARTQEESSQEPHDLIQNYINRISEITDRDDDKRVRGIAAFKKILFENYIVTELPQSYVNLQERILIEQGRGAEVQDGFTNEQKIGFLENIRLNQMHSLSTWIDYLGSKDAMYPDWAKYWALRGVLNVSTYDKSKQGFATRTTDTVAPFPELNREALAYVVDIIESLQSTKIDSINEQIRIQRNKLKKAQSLMKQTNSAEAELVYQNELVELTSLEENRLRILPKNPVEPGVNEFANEGRLVSDEEYFKILQTENFSKYYAFALEHVVADNSELFKTTEGKWVVFKKDSDPTLLVNAIQGHGTGWCTAGKSTAAAQLKDGDFYVYFSQNSLGEEKIPRLAIRMENNRIAEVRGVAPQQEIDQYMSSTLEEKMTEFGDDGSIYRLRASNMKQLTEISNKVDNHTDLNEDEIRFIYELDGEI